MAAQRDRPCGIRGRGMADREHRAVRRPPPAARLDNDGTPSAFEPQRGYPSTVDLQPTRVRG
jgi:hypothetical protein